MRKYDVAVIGGGFSGVAAAIAAAREGVKVLLIEKGNCLGGAAVNSLVNPFMYYWTNFGKERKDLSRGVFSEIHKRLENRNALFYESFLEEELKFILSEMVENEGIDVLYHARLYDVKKENDLIKSVYVAVKSGKMEIEADYFIDATGDAQLAYLGGCKTVLGRDKDNLCQPMTLCFRLGNVDTDAFFESFEELKKEHKRALDRGELINPRENILVFKMPVDNVLHFNTTRVIRLDPTDPFDITEAEKQGRKQVYEIYEFMKKHASGLDKSFLMATASEIGVRESRKIVGKYVLTGKDITECKKFPDAICACNYDIDIHNPEGTGTSHYYFRDGEYYTIPYRCLIPEGVSNLLVAGRCISSDQEAQASYRIMPTVCCIGEAAGAAVANAVKNRISVEDVDVQEVQTVLKNNNAFLGL